MMEQLEYIICPVCKEQIKLNYNVGKHEGVKTEDMSIIFLDYPRRFKPDETPRKVYLRVSNWVHICNHCKGIIGISGF